MATVVPIRTMITEAGVALNNDQMPPAHGLDLAAAGFPLVVRCFYCGTTAFMWDASALEGLMAYPLCPRCATVLKEADG
jgi:NAD-dependent SIR2 family protein deacetylase